jgi:tetratricopeptide (TPR) repeat protein
MRAFMVALLAVLLSAPAWAQEDKAWAQVRSLYAKGKVYAGIRKCDHQLSGKEPRTEFLVLRAEGLNRIAENEKAARDARRAHAEVPAQAKAAALQLGIAMAAMGAADSARFWLERSLGQADDQEAHYRLVLLDKNDGRCDTALQHFAAILARDPDHTKALIERGSCHALLSDTAAARTDLDRAVERAPRDPVAYNSRGFYLYALRGQYHQAIADYDRAIKLDPNYSYAFNNRGWAWYKLGDKEKALKNISLAGRKKKSNPYVYRNLGIIALESGEKERACVHFRTALDLGFTQLHGDEVFELAKANCGQRAAPKPNTPQPGNAPGRPTPRTNAPGRTNAP